ncbi:putative membrane protein [Propionispora sp. 2/2-37]|uniref:biotin transporter BioY n=1 Tax=Propionispora sp. 2/2-37 TaxID=1677858 RepID=UPI0006BB80A3|nr:biotin transporter BioY [Propionispora sp. 2/2-37]CUH94812.1 putative membrane protein [Propionispora sp. 2/2-37]
MFKSNLPDLIYAALFAAVISVLGFISIPLPFSPVPVTGQTLGIMLAGSILSARQAGLSVLVFILIGAAGVPVFAGSTGGIGILLGPRGGYLFGFLAGAIMIAWLRGKNPPVWRLVMANTAGGIGMVYLSGVLWLSAVTGMAWSKAVMVGALPYIPGDVGKVLIAALIGSAVRRQLSKSGLSI